MKLIKSEAFQALEEDCKSIMSEGIFVYRQTLLSTYHLLGKRIIEELETNKSIKEQELRSYMTRSLKLSDRTLRRAIQFARKFKNIEDLPDGKNASWGKVCNIYLSDKEDEEKEECNHEWITVIKCKHCKKRKEI